MTYHTAESYLRIVLRKVSISILLNTNTNGLETVQLILKNDYSKAFISKAKLGKIKSKKIAYLCAGVLRMAVHVSQHACERIYLCINISEVFIRPTCLKMRRIDKTTSIHNVPI